MPAPPTRTVDTGRTLALADSATRLEFRWSSCPAHRVDGSGRHGTMFYTAMLAAGL